MSYKTRKLTIQDFHKGYLETLSYLTKLPPEMELPDFIKRYHEVMTPSTTILVVEDGNMIIGTGKIYIEPKMHSRKSYVGHIEDVSIHPDHRRKGVGGLIVNDLVEIAKKEHCYKVILDCLPENVLFYEKCKMTNHGIQMSIYFR